MAKADAVMTLAQKIAQAGLKPSGYQYDGIRILTVEYVENGRDWRNNRGFVVRLRLSGYSGEDYKITQDAVKTLKDLGINVIAQNTSEKLRPHTGYISVKGNRVYASVEYKTISLWTDYTPGEDMEIVRKRVTVDKDGNVK